LRIVGFAPIATGVVLCEWKEWLRRGALALAALVLLLSPAAPARAGDGVVADFYSYLPAMPKLSLPRVNIPFWTDDLKKGRNAYQNGNYPRALKYFRRESEAGNPVADWYLGHMYRQGRGVPRDDAIAYTYYSRVSELYDPDETDEKRLAITIDAVLRVADYQRDGVASAGIPQNATLAARTYLNVATTYGHPAAQYALGLMNMKGIGMKQNPQQGLKWLIAAARKRHAPAEAYLGELYWQGKYVQEDRTRAVMWYILAVESARPEENPEIFDRLNAMKASASEDQLLEADARARVWGQQYPVRKKPGF
jgi:TPR repeat protein